MSMKKNMKLQKIFREQRELLEIKNAIIEIDSVEG